MLSARGRRRWVGVAVLLLATACGLDESGVTSEGNPEGDAGADGTTLGDGSSDGTLADTSGDDGGRTETGADGAGDDGGTAGDAPPDTTIDAGPCPGADAASCPAPPVGWAFVGYAPNRASACGAGLVTADRVESPSGGACTCTSCSISQPPDCTRGSIAFGADDQNGGNCTQATGTFANTPAGSCEMLGTSVTLKHFLGTPPAPQGGTCAATLTTDKSSLTATSVRLCEANGAEPACVGALCAASTECVMQAGDLACPGGTPYVTKHLVGDAPDLACSACGCGPTGIAAACTGTMSFFTDPSCTTGEKQAAVDGQCHGIASGAYSSHKYAGTLDPNVTPSCTGAVSTATRTVTGDVATVCCR